MFEWLEKSAADNLAELAEMAQERHLKQAQEPSWMERLLLGTGGPTDEQQIRAMNAQHARSGLGVLGANQEAINNAIQQLRAGQITQDQAEEAIRGAVPGGIRQLQNMPSAIGTALQTSSPVAETARQLDVLGLKNVFDPLHGNERYIDPRFGGLALGAGGAMYAGRRLGTRYKMLDKLLSGGIGSGGGSKATSDPLLEILQKEYGAGAEPALEAFRQARRRAASGLPPIETAVAPPGAQSPTVPAAASPLSRWQQANQRVEQIARGMGAEQAARAVSSVSGYLRHPLNPHPNVIGHADPRVLLKSLATTAAPAAAAAAKSVPFITRSHLQEAYGTLTDKTPGFRPGKLLLSTGLAAALPLVLREWFGRGGYRRGGEQASALVQNTAPPPVPAGATNDIGQQP